MKLSKIDITEKRAKFYSTMKKVLDEVKNWDKDKQVKYTYRFKSYITETENKNET